MSKPYLPLDIFLEIQSKGLSSIQKQGKSASDEVEDNDNGNDHVADEKLTFSHDQSLLEESLEIHTHVEELGKVSDNKEKALNGSDEKEVREDEPQKQGDSQRSNRRKKRKRRKKKARKKDADPPQLPEQQKITMSTETCTMTTRAKKTIPATRPFSLPLSFALPLPIRALSLSPLRDGPVKVTTPEGMRSLHSMSTLSVINENESIDEESSTFDDAPNEIGTNSTNNNKNNTETLTVPELSTLSAILNANRDNNGRRNLNNCNNINDNNSKNSNVEKYNDNNNNNKNIPCKIITSDYDVEINNVDYKLRDVAYQYGDSGDRQLEFRNECSNNSRLGGNFSGLYRLNSLVDSHFNDRSATPGLEGVKAMANRLNLATRRPSYQQWRDLYIGSSGVPRFPDLSREDQADGKLTEERKDRINSALEWIKTELGQMRAVDHNLATQLLTLRNDIHRLKLERSCENHQDLLEDVKDELSERETLSAVCDIPYDMADDNPLKHLGVTRMNICSRRFSMC